MISMLDVCHPSSSSGASSSAIRRPPAFATRQRLRAVVGNGFGIVDVEIDHRIG
jgi:hypothetical protein